VTELRDAAVSLTFAVNGRRARVTVERDVPLLYVLRNHLGLKGPRFGCGMGLCGACMVIIEGRAVTSCDLPIYAVAGKKITTVEGLADGNRLHPLQQAFVEEGAGQCGFCLSGILISAKALLDRNPHPRESEIRSALEPNVCRCGAHVRILRAIARATDLTQA
jgi:nicotinate dehydrogenase subunit A